VAQDERQTRVRREWPDLRIGDLVRSSPLGGVLDGYTVWPIGHGLQDMHHVGRFWPEDLAVVLCLQDNGVKLLTSTGIVAWFNATFVLPT